MGEENSGLHQQEFNPFFLSSLWGPVLVAHKTGSFQKPPVPPVQHEVRVQDGPSLPQPTMTISRSQSPLPPVDWKTYTSSGRKLRALTSSSPRAHSKRGAEAGLPRETASLLRYKGEGQSRVSFPYRVHILRGPPHPKIREAGILAVSLSQVFRTKKASSRHHWNHVAFSYALPFHR